MVAYHCHPHAAPLAISQVLHFLQSPPLNLPVTPCTCTSITSWSPLPPRSLWSSAVLWQGPVGHPPHQTLVFWGQSLLPYCSQYVEQATSPYLLCPLSGSVQKVPQSTPVLWRFWSPTPSHSHPFLSYLGYLERCYIKSIQVYSSFIADIVRTYFQIKAWSLPAFI